MNGDEDGDDTLSALAVLFAVVVGSGLWFLIYRAFVAFFS